MAVPIASVYTVPITNANRAANHQLVRSPAQNSFLPSHFNPVPVGAALKGGITGTAYSETISAQGGTSPYTFAVTSGAVPTGTTMSSGGVISGTPIVVATSTFTVTVTDSMGYTGSYTFSISVAAPSAGGGYSATFLS
jgi:large repetitive protein